MLAQADALLAKDASSVTVVTELPEFHPREETDHVSAEAILTVTRLLHFARQPDSETLSPSADGAAEHAPTLYQINHARILEPKGLENVFTNNGDRLWPNLRVIDGAGTIEIRMREKAALSLSGALDAATFADMAAKGVLNFPILSSIRITMRKSTRTEDVSHDGGDNMDICIVEAAEQNLFCPRSLPNASLNYLGELLHAVAPDPTRMIAAPMSQV